MLSNPTKHFKHCELCKNKIYNIQYGTFCSLTNKLPDFINKCDKIVFNENLETIITSVNIEYEKIKNEKKWAYSYFIVFLIMGMSMLFFTYFFTEYISSIVIKVTGKAIVVFPTINIIFISMGIILLSYAFGALNRHNIDWKKSNLDKLELDTILGNYEVTYDFKATFKDRILKPTEIKMELKMKHK
jgi:hypothetical protein